MTNETVYLNPGRFVIEGTFDVDTTGAVLNLTMPNGGTKTVRGQHMSVVKSGTGQYDVTVKLASALDGKPVFQPVELLDGTAKLIAATVATALGARVASVTTDSNGNIVIRVLTTGSTGAAADTTAAVTVGFMAVVCTVRLDPVF
jgi:hypothetical protein